MFYSIISCIFYIIINQKMKKMLQFGYIFFIFFYIFTAGHASSADLRSNPEPGAEPNSISSSAEGKKFMISTADKRASLVAKEILQKGGNAMDAVIAAQMILSIVEPQSSGLGGGGFLLYYDAKSKSVKSWDGRETASSTASRDMFMKNTKDKMKFMDAVSSSFSVGVPGVVSMLGSAHLLYGSLPWEELVEPSIKLAKKGFTISPRLHYLLGRVKHVKKDLYANNLFYSQNGAPKPVGSKVLNYKLTESLKKISLNYREINEGSVASQIIDKIEPFSQKYTITLEDLKNWKSKLKSPICVNYREYKICGMAPPSSGGVNVLQILKILEHADLVTLKNDKTMMQHVFLEASKLSYMDRAAYIADPDYVYVPVYGLLDPKYLADRYKLIYDDKVNLSIQEGVPDGFVKGERLLHKTPEFSSTTHISIVDREGNAAALTSSIEFAFGSGIMAAGFFLNNQLTDFSFKPKLENGSVVANSVEPGKRPRSSMSPTIVLDNENNLIGVLGSPGGSRIICYVAEALIRLIDYGMHPEQVVRESHTCNRGGKSEIELSFKDEKLVSELELFGHEIVKKKMTSGLNIIWKGINGKWIGASDSRREGIALGM